MSSPFSVSSRADTFFGRRHIQALLSAFPPSPSPFGSKAWTIQAVIAPTHTFPPSFFVREPTNTQSEFPLRRRKKSSSSRRRRKPFFQIFHHFFFFPPSVEYISLGGPSLKPTRKRKVCPPPAFLRIWQKGGANWRRFTRFSQKKSKEKKQKRAPKNHVSQSRDWSLSLASPNRYAPDPSFPPRHQMAFLCTSTHASEKGKKRESLMGGIGSKEEEGVKEEGNREVGTKKTTKWCLRRI